MRGFTGHWRASSTDALKATTSLEQRALIGVEPTRPSVGARFIHVGGEKLYVRGVTYGTFRDGPDGFPYPDPETVADDFAAMRAAGVNALRLYTVPPRWLLDLAHEHSLLAMVGLAWETHVAFLDDRRQANRIVDRVAEQAASCANHPALLCYAVGNEIPATIVRWHGRRRIERFVERLYSTVKDIDPGALVTYANYPSTEYLQLPYLDLVCFNVYLESLAPLQTYLTRLHNLAGDRPLLITELGLDSRRHGPIGQAQSVEEQLRAAYALGCAGAFVFSWTDEWHRGGADVDDWEFGLVDHERRPKPALAGVERAFADAPHGRTAKAPRISVIVCSYNGDATIGTCLQSLGRLDYPDYEVIVVDDGSTDRTAEIAEQFDVRLIRTENCGLSAARNTGLDAATGDIVAFTDDDAWPDPHWLRYLEHAFATSDHVAVGGPNLAPDGGGLVERAVAHAPGGPNHVLISDEVAEHVPGCNMAFRREALEAVGGFDPQFRIAGDDVDICWRLQDHGGKIGFCAGAIVVHRRRGSIDAYLRQQVEYGKAEALLERKWPHRYNRGGHVMWAGRVMQRPTRTVWRHPRVGYGTWGGNLFQSLYDRRPLTLTVLPLMPEWYLGLVVLAVLSLIGVVEQPLVPWTEGAPAPVEWLLLATAWTILTLGALWQGLQVPRNRRARGAVVAVTSVLVLLQPLARLLGRLRYGLTPWRQRGPASFAFPWPRNRQEWSEQWRSQSERLVELERRLHGRCMTVRRGGEFDRWDLHVRLGSLATARVRMTVEEHGHGRQLVRYRIWPRWSRLVVPFTSLLALWLGASVGPRPYLAATIGAFLLIVLARALHDAGAAIVAIVGAVEHAEPAEREEPAQLDRRVMAVRGLFPATAPAAAEGSAMAEATHAFADRRIIP